MHFDRVVGVTTKKRVRVLRMALQSLCVFGFVCSANAQTKPSSGYESLDQNVRAAKDEASVRALTDDILERIFLARLSPSLYQRIIRAQLSVCQEITVSLSHGSIV